MTAATEAEATPKLIRKVLVQFPESADNERDRALADFVLQPSVNAAVVAAEYYAAPFGEQDLGALAATLAEHTRKLESGSLADCEAMLLGQAHALQAIFVNLARRATKQEHLRQWETYIRVALKAQSQCRATLETLANIKNPPTVFARQANIAHGPQQVNNGPPAPSRPQENEITPNRLLEASNGERMDTGAASATGGTNQELEAVGAINRPANGRGEGES